MPETPSLPEKDNEEVQQSAPAASSALAQERGVAEPMTFTTIDEKFQDLSRSVTSQGEQLAQIEERVGGLETSVGSLETKVDRLEERVGALEERVSALETRVGALETKVEKLSTEVQHLNKSVERLITKLDRVAETMNEKFTDLSNRITAIEAFKKVTWALLLMQVPAWLALAVALIKYAFFS